MPFEQALHYSRPLGDTASKNTIVLYMYWYPWVENDPNGK